MEDQDLVDQEDLEDLVVAVAQVVAVDQEDLAVVLVLVELKDTVEVVVQVDKVEIKDTVDSMVLKVIKVMLDQDQMVGDGII